MTRFSTKTSLQDDPNQTVHLYTCARDAEHWYLVLAAPGVAGWRVRSVVQADGRQRGVSGAVGAMSRRRSRPESLARRFGLSPLKGLDLKLNGS